MALMLIEDGKACRLKAMAKTCGGNEENGRTVHQRDMITVEEVQVAPKGPPLVVLTEWSCPSARHASPCDQ